MLTWKGINMPQKRSAYKELRKGKKRHARNLAVASEMKTLAKKFNLFLADKKFDEAKKALSGVSSKFDRAARKGIIHKKAASKKISRLSKKLSTASSKKK